jgi:hypothetical protein
MGMVMGRDVGGDGLKERIQGSDREDFREDFRESSRKWWGGFEI